MLRDLCRSGSVHQGRVQARGGVRRPHALPLLGPGREGRRLLLAAASLSLAAALVGDGRPGILARRPCIRVRFPSGSRVRQLTSWWRGSPSTHPSWTHEDTSVHARGRDRSPEERRVGLLNSGGNEAPLPSGVPHHTPPALTRPAPLLSHTHSSREPGEGRRFRTGCR